MQRSSAVRWFLIWTAVCAVFSSQTASRLLMRGQPVDWFRVVGLEALYWLPWMILTPVLVAAARRWPLGGSDGARYILPHLWTMAAVSLAQVALAQALQLGAIAAFHTPRGGMSPLFSSCVAGAPALLIMACWKYWVVMGIWVAFDSARRLRERELRAANLERQLATAQLHALKAQLQPHFLFNTLHSVSMLNLVDVDAANRLLVQLSCLLRLALDRADTLEVPVAHEIEFLERYLEVEQVRFEDRLCVEVRLDEGVEDTAVPNLILQPLVENALRHGLSPLARRGCLSIRAYRSTTNRHAVVLEVEDDGAGLPAGWSMQSAGLGLGNVRDRLAAAYGSKASLELHPGASSGVLARIVIPVAA